MIRASSRQFRDRFRSRYGPWAVVTGASSGIGEAIAGELAAAGINLILIARRQAVLETLAGHLAAATGIDVRVIAADLSRPADVARVLDATGAMDIGLLVQAAGFGTSGPFLDTPLTAELEMLDVNCRAVVELSHEFGRRFAERGRGGMIFLSSIVAFQGTPYASHYSATKAYVQTLAEGLRVELAPRGVDVLASAPGPVHSGFAARANMRMGHALLPADVAGATLRALGRRTTVLPGLLSKLLSWSLAPLPRDARVGIMGRVMTGMTAHAW